MTGCSQTDWVGIPRFLGEELNELRKGHTGLIKLIDETTERIGTENRRPVLRKQCLGSGDGALFNEISDGHAGHRRRMADQCVATPLDPNCPRAVVLPHHIFLRHSLSRLSPAGPIKCKPWQRLYFNSDPHGQGSLRPTLTNIDAALGATGDD
jgi:hypothetical protein